MGDPMFSHKRSSLAGVAVAATLILAACQDAPTMVRAPVLSTSAAVFVKGGGGLPPFSEALADLGDRIFDDQNLSVARNQGCNSCHEAEWGFTGPSSAINAAGAVYPGSIPSRFGDRKPPSSAYSTLSPVLHRSRQGGGLFVGGNFWDGRATGERLGSPAAEQAQGPFLNPVEQALPDAACVVYRIREESDYIDDYRALWGDNIMTIRFPSYDVMEGICSDSTLGPGEHVPLSAEDRLKLADEYDNIAISIAIYEESHNLFSSKFDAWRKGLYQFTRPEQRGFALFQGKAKCANCHTSSGQQPAFTDHTFDNLGVPANPDNPIYAVKPTFVDGGLGSFLATRREWSAYQSSELGKMRVPTLRNVDLRPYPGAVKAYMHNGVFKSLEEVVRFYNTRDVLPECPASASRADWGVLCWPAPEVPVNVNRDELGNLGLTAEEEALVVAYLRTLSDGFIPGGRGKHLTGRR
jgi:cytochrome c peroxidase